MIIDSHFHLIRRKNFDADTYKKLGLALPNDTDLDQLVTWMKNAGIEKGVAMGQDMSRIWNTTFGEEYLLEAVNRYPDFLIGLASVEPLDKANRFNEEAFEYFRTAIEKNKGASKNPDLFKGISIV